MLFKVLQDVNNIADKVEGESSSFWKRAGKNIVKFVKADRYDIGSLLFVYEGGDIRSAKKTISLSERLMLGLTVTTENNKTYLIGTVDITEVIEKLGIFEKVFIPSPIIGANVYEISSEEVNKIAQGVVEYLVTTAEAEGDYIKGLGGYSTKKFEGLLNYLRYN